METTAAVVSTHFPDVINGMPVIVHRHDSFFTFRPADVFLFGWLVYILLHINYMGRSLAQHGTFLRQRTEHLQYIGGFGFRKQIPTAVNSVVNRNNLNNLLPGRT